MTPPIESYETDGNASISVSTVTLSEAGDGDPDNYTGISELRSFGNLTSLGKLPSLSETHKLAIGSVPSITISTSETTATTNIKMNNNNNNNNDDNRSSNSNGISKTEADFETLKKAIQMVHLEANKAEEKYKSECLLLSKANEQLMKFSKLLQEQDAQLAATEEALRNERNQREAAEKHFVKLKKMMVVKDVEVTEAEQKKKAEHGLRKGAEREMTMLRRQLQAKDTQLAAADRKYQKECKRREKFENQMLELSKKAGKKTAEEQYQLLQRIRDEDIEAKYSVSAPDGATSKENSFASANNSRKFNDRQESEERVGSLLAQLHDLQDQLRHTEQDLKRANERYERERQLREEADKQVIVMREKGFASHFDRRTSARTHAEDCLNTERLKLRYADLQEQYEHLKNEAKKSLEKARDRVNEEKSAREALEQQMVANRKSFEEALEKEKEDCKAKIEELELKLKETKEEFEAIKNSANGSSEELRKKCEDFQQQLIDAKAEGKKEQTLRLEIQAEMKAMEIELDTFEAELKNARETLSAREKEIADLRSATSKGEESHVEVKEMLTMIENELKASEARCKLLREKCQNEQKEKEKLDKYVYLLKQKLKQLSTELQAAHSHERESEERCEVLRQRVQAVTTNFQKTMAQNENSKQKHSHLQQKIQSLTNELEETKRRCCSLQESLHKAEYSNRLLKEEVETSETSVAKRRREESEQEQINMEAKNQAVRLSEDKWRQEKRLREQAEEKCRSLRQEIFQLKHEQVMSSKNTANTNDSAKDTEAKVAALEEELVAAESRRNVMKQLFEEEKKRREELEQQNLTFREMIPEYAQAEEKYQKERRLRSDAESTIDSLRQKLIKNKFWSATSGHDDSTQDSVNQANGVDPEHIIRLKAELAELQSQYQDAQAELSKSNERYQQEHNLRIDVEHQLQDLRKNKGGNSDVEKKLRAKAEKQVMSLRLKVEAKESEISNLKAQLSESRSGASSAEDSRHRRRRSGVGVDEVRTPPPPPGRQLEYRSSGVNSIPTHSEKRHQPLVLNGPHAREEILESLPDYVKNNFGRIGFVKHSVYEYWPALVLDPFTVPNAIRQKWLELYYEFDKRDMFLVYLYGRRHRESVNAYPIVEAHHFISYEEGKEQGLASLPQEIENKNEYGEELTEIEEEFSEGLIQIRLDSRIHPRSRTHPLDERRRRSSSDSRGDRNKHQAGVGEMGNASMTSSTSHTSSVGSMGLDSVVELMEGDSPLLVESPTKRPRSEYSLSSNRSTSASGNYSTTATGS